TKLGASKKKSQNSVDKSLDEALEHIDRLKKDMNHLCSDLDLLYNSKKDINESNNDSYQSNVSRNSSFSNLNFEFDDDLMEDFSSLNEHCRLKTPFRELDVPKSVNIFSAEKSTQTNRMGPKIFTIKTMKRISKNLTKQRVKIEFLPKPYYKRLKLFTLVKEFEMLVINSLLSYIYNLKSRSIIVKLRDSNCHF
ncbi:hypothetical protein BpHYR1_030723, partial [Brachionus plicatilis]